MKLGKFKMFLMLLLAFVMALAIVGCEKPGNDDDDPPVVSCDCCDDSCTDCICEAGKDCNPDCDCGSENCNPTVTPPPEESCDCCDDSCTDCICEAGEDCNPDCDCGGTNCNPAPAVDETAPVITFSQDKQDSYTAKAGQTVILPSATANDETDGELELDVAVTSKGATLVKDDSGYLFTSNTAGTYQVSYYAIDAAENEAEEFITVIITPVVAESTLPDGASSDIKVLENGGTYVENFENGYNGALAKGLTYSTSTGEPNASIKADENAIAGNSLFIDYTSCAWNTNTQFWFGSLDNYIKSGKWTISMDVKVLGGTAPSGLYFSFIYDGDQSGENQPYALGAVGETKTITQEVLKTFDSSKSWHFRIFFYTGNSSYSYENFVIAIDNISITYKYVENDVVERTGTPKTVSLDEAIVDGGYTITGADDNYTALSGAALYADISKISASERLTAEQAANLTAANGFNSNYVIVANTQIISFEALKNLCTNPEYIYTLTLKVYAPSSSGWHIFFTNGSGAQSGANAQSSVNGVATFTYEFAGAANYVNIGLYNGSISPVYIGDINIKAVVKQADKTANGYEVGQTWTKSASELNGCNEGQIVICSEINVNDAALSTNKGFESDAVYYTTSTADKNFWMFRAGGTIENGCSYKIVFTLYVTELSNRICVNFDDAVFETVTTTTGYQVVEFNWTATQAVDFFSLYFDGSSTGSFYIASVSYELTAL